MGISTALSTKDLLVHEKDIAHGDLKPVGLIYTIVAEFNNSFAG